MINAMSQSMEKFNNGAAMDPGFQWGKLPSQDNSGQVTRYMMEMRKPKPYELREPPSLLPGKLPKEESPCRDIDVPSCPIMMHSIRLLSYIKKVQRLLAKMDEQDPETARCQYNHSAPSLLSPPSFESGDYVASAPGRSRSSSSTKTDDSNADCTAEKIFTAPDISSDFRQGTRSESYPKLDDETASRLLKKSVGTLSAQAGFDRATSSSLDVLTGIAESFLVSFCKSLRDAADAEALEGRTPFFDCLDQALHESGCTGFKDVHEYWNKRVIRRHRILKQEAEKMAQALKSYQHPEKPDDTKKVPRVTGRSTGFLATYGKWTPVAGMSSSPYPSTSMDTDPPGSSGWSRQRSAVKSEPYESGQSLSYSLAGQESDLVHTKAEYMALNS